MVKWIRLLETEDYEVSNLGQIRNAKTGKILKGSIDERGRIKVFLHIDGKLKGRYLKCLVHESFYGATPDGLCVYQKNGNKADCTLSNLDVGTRSDIVKHSYYLNMQDAHKTRAVRCVNTGKTYKSIAACSLDTGLNASTICRNVNGSTKVTRNGLVFEAIE